MITRTPRTPREPIQPKHAPGHWDILHSNGSGVQIIARCICDDQDCYFTGWVGAEDFIREIDGEPVEEAPGDDHHSIFGPVNLR